MSDSNFNPRHGDLFFPPDMEPFLEKLVKQGDGSEKKQPLDPTFLNKKMVLMGHQGVGKTHWFNILTGSRNRSEEASKSVTLSPSRANALPPAQNLEIVDTPGIAELVDGSGQSEGGIGLDEAMQISKALTRGHVAQTAMFIAFSNNGRVADMQNALSKSLQNILSCNCFQRDHYGTDLGLKEGNKKSPHRTRVFLVVTHRDRARWNGPNLRTWWMTPASSFHGLVRWLS